MADEEQGDQELPDPLELFRKMQEGEPVDELPDPMELFERMRREETASPVDDLRQPLSGDAPPAAPLESTILREPEPEPEQPEEGLGFFGRLKSKFKKSAEDVEPVEMPPMPSLKTSSEERLPSPEELFRQLAEERAELQAQSPSQELPELPDLEEFKRMLEEEEKANLDPDLEKDLSGPERFAATVSDTMFAPAEPSLPSFFDEYEDVPILTPADLTPSQKSPTPASNEPPRKPTGSPSLEADRRGECASATPDLQPALRPPTRPPEPPVEDPREEPEELSTTGRIGPTGTVRVDPAASLSGSSSSSVGLFKGNDPARVYRPQVRPGRPTPQAPPEPTGSPDKAKKKTKLKRFSRYQLAILTRQHAVMLKSGIQLHSTIAFAAEADPEMRPFLDMVLEKVETGYSFSNAISSASRSFDPVYVGLVQAGEQSGRLPEMLSRLADVLEREVEVRKRIVSSITYPLMLLLVCFAGTLGFIFFVIPNLEPLFKDLGVALPMTTRILISSRKYIVPGTITAGVLGLLLSLNWDRLTDYVKSRPYLERRLAAIPFRIPVLGKVYDKVVTARVMYSLSTMLDVGITLNQALARSETTAGNALVAYKLGRARFDLADGHGVTECFQANELFSPSALYLISAGEEAAKLANMFQYVAKLFDEDVEYALEAATALLEPMIMVVMGLVVGFIVVSAAAPTIQLLQSFT